MKIGVHLRGGEADQDEDVSVTVVTAQGTIGQREELMRAIARVAECWINELGKELYDDDPLGPDWWRCK